MILSKRFVTLSLDLNDGDINSSSL